MQQKKNSINFSKANAKCRFSLHYNSDESYLYANKTEVYKFKAKDNISAIIFVEEAYHKILQKITRVKFH